MRLTNKDFLDTLQSVINDIKAECEKSNTMNEIHDSWAKWQTFEDLVAAKLENKVN